MHKCLLYLILINQFSM